MTNKLVLIDGNSIIYRAFFALPLLNNDKGIYTNAVYGFTTMLMRILEEEKPTHMLVAFDAGKTTFRHEQYEEYKGGRQKTPPELSEQFPVLKELLDSFKIAHYELDQYEADDIIGTLSKKGNDESWDVTVISGDRDLLQLVSEHVTVDVTKKGITDVESYTPELLMEKMEVTPEQIIDLKALMGDSSDNIPGVPGVGQKTATKLVKQYRSLEAVYDHLGDISGKKLKENLTEYKDQAFMSKDLVTINRNSPITITVDDIHYNGYEQTEVSTAFKNLGFQSLLERLSGETDESEGRADLEALDYTVVDEVTADMLTGEEAMVLEMMGENYHQEPIEGIGVVNTEHAYFIPTNIAVQSKVFKDWAEDIDQKKYVFDAKKTRVALLNQGIKVKGI